MPVLAEALSVIVRRDSIERVLDGGWREFLELVPNRTLCTDGELARVGFLTNDEVGEFLEKLEGRGFEFTEPDRPGDIAVVDQLGGPTTDCSWLEFGRFRHGNSGGKMSSCWLWDEPRILAGIHMRGMRMKIAAPPGWKFEGSLSDKFTFVPSDDFKKRFEFLRRDGDKAVFRNRLTHEEAAYSGEILDSGDFDRSVSGEVSRIQ